MSPFQKQVRISHHAAVAGLAGGETPQRPTSIAAGAWRRLDALSRWAVVAVEQLRAQGAMLDSSCAVLVHTGYGSIGSTLLLADSMRSYGDAKASPTPFTTSVHSATAGALGELLGLRGPCSTLSCNNTGSIAALRWAHSLLVTGQATQALVVVGDAHQPWSIRVVGEMTPPRLPGAALGQGAAACLLTVGGTLGRELRLGLPRTPASLAVLGQALGAAGAGRLQRMAAGCAATRYAAPAGGWWPGCVLADIPWQHAGDLLLAEGDRDQLLAAWLGPLRSA